MLRFALNDIGICLHMPATSHIGVHVCTPMHLQQCMCVSGICDVSDVGDACGIGDVGDVSDVGALSYCCYR